MDLYGNYIMFLLNWDQFLLIFWAFTRAFPQISGYVGMGARDHPRPMLVPSDLATKNDQNQL